jgi:hypothetical protein
VRQLRNLSPGGRRTATHAGSDSVTQGRGPCGQRAGLMVSVVWLPADAMALSPVSTVPRRTRPGEGTARPRASYMRAEDTGARNT